MSCLWFVATPGSARAAEPVPIAEGTLSWGVKGTWRTYIGGGTMSPGVTQGEDGAYNFPIASGTYDPDARTTVVRGSGSVHWQGHPWMLEQHMPVPPGWTGSRDIFQLDVTFKDPELTIGRDRSVLTVEVVSRLLATWEMIDYGRIVIGEVDASAGTPTVAGDRTTWTKLPVAWSDQMPTMYEAGVSVDPVSLTYVGPGGAPDFAERWSIPGGTGVAQATNETYGETNAWKDWWKDEANGLVHHTARTEAGATVTQAFDLVAGRNVEDPIPLTTEMQNAIVNDPKTSTLYYQSVRNGAVDTALSFRRQTGYERRALAHPFTIVDNARARANGWDARRGRLIQLVRERPDDVAEADYEHYRWTVHTFTRGDDEAFAERTYALPDGPAGFNADWYAGELKVLPDGSFVDLRQPIAGQDGATPPATIALPRVTLDDGTDTATVADVPGSAVPWTTFSGLKGWRSAFVSERHLALVTAGSGALPTKVLHYGYADGVLEPDARIGEMPVTFLAAYAMDPVDGTVWQNDSKAQRLMAVRDGRVVADLKPTIVNTVNAIRDIGVLGDQTLWFTSSAGSPAGIFGVDTGIATFAHLGYAPSVTAQPDDASVTVEPGAAGAVTFTAASTGTPAPELRWQRRAPGSGRFADLAGQVGASLTVQAAAADNGAAYRAVAKNAAGELATDPARLEVRYRPTVTYDVVDRGGVEGDDVTFDVLANGSPTPEITWQRRVGGFWQAVDAADGDVAVDDNKLTVRAVNRDMDGTRFRALVRNAVGTATTRAATLTVRAPVTEPVTFGSGTFDWGFANRWRCYVVGSVARGGIDVSGGVTRVPGTEATGSLCPGAGEGSRALRFPVLGQGYDPTTGRLEVRLGGTVRFWGHAHHVPGDATPQLDTTFSRLRLVAQGTTGTIYADVVGATMEHPEPVTRVAVPIATVDLDQAGPTPDGDVGLSWSDATTKLTAEGAEAFGSYPAGEPFDPVSMALRFGTPQADDSAPETPVIEQPIVPASPVAPVAPPASTIDPGVTPVPIAGEGTRLTARPARFSIGTAVHTLGTTRTATVATVTCAAKTTCALTAPSKAKIRIAGKSYTITIAAPKRLAAGRKATIRIALPKAALSRLRGRTATVAFTVTVKAGGAKVGQQVRAKIRAAKVAARS
ncbi:MAG TPA: HtaA domain-containing protein [Baekduia sp.]|uniref:HtaA domain-containing protein n=1 Tax=Baekduia sp. TaxID=2600305 RepID=UPI002D770975|nr:HtaA domain-containing protein [Baekduia sp.]HET6510301.1 HtaA domain-containing protein [Baekduia sp.]